MPIGQVIINTNSAETIELIPAPPGKSFIRVIHYRVSSAGSTVVTFLSGETEIDVVQATTVAGSGIVTPNDPTGIMDCNPGEALSITNGSAQAIGGLVKYVVIPGGR